MDKRSFSERDICTKLITLALRQAGWGDEADRALDEARSKAVCIQKRAQAALALAENIAKSRRMIDTLGG
jgi:type I site-specific restriction endonuclease